MSAELSDIFHTTYPFASFLIPAIFVILFLVIVGIAAKYFLNTDSLAKAGAGLITLILGFGFFGISLTGAMEAQASPEHRVVGTIVDTTDSGKVAVADNTMIETRMVLFQTLDDVLMGPIEITTGNVEHAVNEIVTLSCDIPANYETQFITCEIIDVVS